MPLRTLLMCEICWLSIGISESETSRNLVSTLNESGQLIDPHTAVGVAAWRRNRGLPDPVIILSTAHAAKFPEAVSAATGVTPALPAAAKGLWDRPERFDRLPADVETVKAYVRAFAGV